MDCIKCGGHLFNSRNNRVTKELEAWICRTCGAENPVKKEYKKRIKKESIPEDIGLEKNNEE